MAQLEQDKRLVRTHFEALNEGRYQLLDEVHHPHGRNHAPGDGAILEGG
jgi:hypothetical protein